MTIWVIDIPNWHPARLNQWDGRHWSARAKAKKSDRELILCYAKIGKVPAATGKRRVSLLITLGPRQRGADPDAYWKSTLDGLVHCGALKNDSREWVQLGPVDYARGEQRATRITLEALE